MQVQICPKQLQTCPGNLAAAASGTACHLLNSRHQVGFTEGPVGFCVIMNPPSADERHVAPFHTKSPESNFAADSSPRAESSIARALMGAASDLTR